MGSNSPQYKLRYFDVRGLAELCRYIFAYAQVEYQDDRLKREDWASIKPTTPFHQLPVLEVDGKVIAQSNAIARFLARRFNLAGKDEYEQALVDGLADYLNDTRQPLSAWFREQDETRKKELKDKYFNETVHDFLKTFEEHLRKNGGGNGFFVGNGPTWVDFGFATGMGMLQTIEPAALEKYPLLKAHEERVNNLKGIKEWIAKRPQTAM